jgi:ADP-ribose pyrophosphatase
MDFFEKPVEQQTGYTGRIVNVRCDTAELPNGKRVAREVGEHPGGVAIVAVTERGGVLMVTQYRYAVSRALLELPAGKLEPGEDPAACAARELSEETGCSAETWTFLGEMYTSPGYCRETLHVYLATGLTHGRAHPEEDELLSVREVPMAELVDMIIGNGMPDGKSVFGILKAKLYLNL